jgi:hypothetical protein
MKNIVRCPRVSVQTHSESINHEQSSTDVSTVAQPATASRPHVNGSNWARHQVIRSSVFQRDRMLSSVSRSWNQEDFHGREFVGCNAMFASS